MASLSLAKSWHCLGSSSSLWSLSLWFRMVSSSLELLAWSRRSLAKRLHCWDSSSYSWRNSFSTWNMAHAGCYASRMKAFEAFHMSLQLKLAMCWTALNLKCHPIFTHQKPGLWKTDDLVPFPKIKHPQKWWYQQLSGSCVALNHLQPNKIYML